MQWSKCKSCDAPGIWMRTVKGKYVLAEPDSIDEENLEFDEDGRPVFDASEHIAHFANCPDAEQWRR